MQILINGTIQGLLISLLAIGFSIVYNSTGIIYVAQGAIYAISPFLLLSFLKFGMGTPFAVFFTFVITILLSMSLEKMGLLPIEWVKMSEICFELDIRQHAGQDFESKIFFVS